MTYNVLRWGLFLLLGIYAIVGVTTDSLPQREVYPFFSWRLFDEIPQTQRHYSIRILAYNGRAFEPPVWLSDAARTVASELVLTPAYHLIVQRLGEAIARGDTAGVSAQRRNLERIFEKPARYEVVHIMFNPLAFFRTREVMDLQLLESFESGQQVRL
jgi:hypothetical protein